MNGRRRRERHYEHDQIYGGLLNEMEEMCLGHGYSVKIKMLEGPDYKIN